jgi:hypothetical protein
MLNVRDYSEGWKHQKLNTPNCPSIFPKHYLYVYHCLSALVINQHIYSECLCFTPPILLLSNRVKQNINCQTTCSFLWIVLLFYQFNSISTKPSCYLKQSPTTPLTEAHPTHCPPVQHPSPAPNPSNYLVQAQNLLPKIGTTTSAPNAATAYPQTSKHLPAVQNPVLMAHL